MNDEDGVQIESEEGKNGKIERLALALNAKLKNEA